jgi:hypothetical protein
MGHDDSTLLEKSLSRVMQTPEASRGLRKNSLGIGKKAATGYGVKFSDNDPTADIVQGFNKDLFKFKLKNSTSDVMMKRQDQSSGHMMSPN